MPAKGAMTRPAPDKASLRARHLPRREADFAAVTSASAATTEARRTRALKAVIRRIGTGGFGRCDACGDFIGKARLDLDPTLMRCRGRAA